MERINSALTDYWPCLTAKTCGYCCCLCSLGLSLFFPRICVNDAERFCRAEIRRLNRQPLWREAGVEWALQRACCSSAVELSLFDVECAADGSERQPEAAAVAKVAESA
eukprot:PLAT7573.2.p1 GENE.PLAT7573.2~~PLAT7573.2.p1  ORF type:complete len:109 (+),score=4.24 PLAT7573.2:253-579(+)